MESTIYLRATAGFFVRGRGPAGSAGIVNPDETVSVSKSEAMDIVAANRGVRIEQKEYEAGPKADFVAKDADGKVIKTETLSRAQIHARAREQQERDRIASAAMQAALVTLASPPARPAREARS